MKKSKLLIVLLLVALACLSLVACEQHVHTYKWAIDTKSTETAKGSATGTCICGETTTRELPALTDTAFWTVNTVDATHESAGSKTYTNAETELSIVAEIPAGEHTFGLWSIVTKATETTPGSAKRTCSGCNDDETMVLPVLADSSFWTVTTEAADHTKTGKNTYTNAATGLSIIVDIGKIDHVFQEIVTADALKTPATCTSPAVYNKTCSCGEKSDETFTFGSMIAHGYGAWSISVEPTATVTGTAVRSCACGVQDSATIAVLGDTSIWTVVHSQDASHAEGGVVVYSSIYGTVTTTSAKIDHTYGAWTITKDPTETEKGSAIKICTCGHSVVEDVPVLSNNIWTIDDSNRPTHDAAGSVVYTSDYGTVTIVVPAGEHSFGSWTNNNDGTHTRTCDCGKGETDAHVFDQRVANSSTKKADATCTTGAKYAYSCVCGAVSVDDTFFNGEGTGHALSEFTLTKAPTCTETGLATIKCSNCDYENTNSVIAALGHSWSTTYYPYYGSSQYWDADTGEVIVDEDTDSESHVKVCTVCGIFDEDNKVAHAYGDEYLVARKDQNGHNISIEHACDCGYTAVVRDSIGYFEYWTLVDRKEATYNEAGYEIRKSGSYTYTLAIPKLVAPYENKTYNVLGVSRKDGKDMSAVSLYAWSSATITVDSLGKAVGLGHPFQGEVAISMVNASTGEISIALNGTKKYSGFISDLGIMVIYEGNTDSVFIVSPYDISVALVSGSYWNGGMAINYNIGCDTGIGHDYNIAVVGSNIYFNVTFKNLAGVILSAGEVVNSEGVAVDNVAIYNENGTVIQTFVNNGTALVVADGLQGSYTADLGSGSETIVLNGCGAFTAGTKSGIYTIVEGKSYTADMYVVADGKNIAYYQITIADGVLTATKPTVTVTYNVGEHGNAIDNAQANVNVAFTPVTPTSTATSYIFAGWYTDAGLTNAAGKTITPVEGTSITLYAKWEFVVHVNIQDEHGTLSSIALPDGATIGDFLPKYESGSTIVNGYVFVEWKVGDEHLDTELTVSVDDEGITIVAAWEWAGNVTFTEAGAYTFVYDTATGYWKSNNQGKNSTSAIMEFVATSGKVVVSFDYYCESEAADKWDFLTIWYGPDWKSVTAGGKACDWNWKTITTTLDFSINDSNQKVIIEYKKDGSSQGGSDTAYIRNLTINGIPVASQQPLNKDVAGTYTSDDTTVVVGAGGLVTIDDVAAVYTTIDTNKIGVTLADGYKEITLNKANNTCTIAVPQVNVIYDLGGHGDNVTTPVNKMTTQTIAAEPTAEGYVFRGWYTTAEFTTEAPATFVASADVTYYAKWDKAVTITYNYNDGGAHANTTDKTYYANDKVTSLQAVDFTYGTKVFAGWFTQDGSTSGDWGTEFALNTDITESITLYAKWVVPSPLMGEYVGYKINNASTASSGKKITIDALGNVTGDRTGTVDYDSTTGKLKIGSYYCTYDATVGMIVISNSTSATSFGSDTYFFFRSMSVTTSASNIVSWNSNKTRLIAFTIDGSATPTYVFLNDSIVVANVTWSAKDKTYTAVENLANVSANAVMITVTAGETTYSYAKNSSNSFVALTDELQGKYTNGEDYVVLNGVGVIYFKDGTSGKYTVATDGTISALTSTANYTITLDTSAKTFTKVDNKVTIKYYDGETELTDKQAAPYSGIKYTLIAGPEKTGYVFRGWYESADFSGSNVTSVTPTENKTYYAKYDAAVTLTFDYNGYTDGETSSHRVTDKFVNDTVGTLPAVLNDAKYGTKVFAGWFTANGTDGNWGDQVTTSTILTETTTTYYAKWIEPHAMMGTYKGAEVWNSASSNTSKNLTVTSLGVASGTQNGTITDYNAETGYFVLVNGTSRYYGYYADGILVVAYSNGGTSFGNDTYFYFKDATTLSLTSANVVSWNGNKTRIINFTVDGESKIIYINDTEVYCDVDVVDATGNSVAISSALKTAGTVITIKKGATSIVTYGYVGDTFVLSDGYQGTYTASKDIGIGSIVLDGYGSATIGEAPVAYDLDSANSKITVVYNNRMYVLSLDKTTFTYSQVQDGYQGEYTMPDGTTKINLDGYGKVDETSTYVVSGATITIYDGETSTTYGIDTKKKTLVEKSIFAGLKFNKSDSQYVQFDDTPEISGKYVCGNSGWYVTFTGTYDAETRTITCTVVTQSGNAAAIGSTFTFTVSDGKLVLATGSFSSNVEASIGSTYTNADFVLA